MRTFLPIVVLAILLTACASIPSDSLDVLILGQTGDDTYMSDSSGVYRRIARNMSDPIIEAGHNVYDETLVTMDDFSLTGNINATEARDIARSSGSNIDVVVIYEFSNRSRSRGSSREVKVIIDASILGVKTSRNYGDVSSSYSFRVAPNCTDRCLRDRISDEASHVAEDVGAQIAVKLGGVGSPGKSKPRSMVDAYEITLSGFKSFEMQDIEDALAGAKGYQTHRIQFSNSRRMDLWYETKANESDVGRTLGRAFDELGINAHVQFSGNRFSVTKTVPKAKRSETEETGWDW